MSVILVRNASGAPAGCVQGGGSVVFNNPADNFNWRQFGNYVVQMDNWGPMPGSIRQWVNDQTCWGVTNVSRHTEQGSVACYPSVVRGWNGNGDVMTSLSTGGGSDWTTKSGMGIQLSALTKCKIKWGIQKVPTTPVVTRWDALCDVYLHTTATPSFSVFPPKVDISIFQMVMDANYYGPTYASEHGAKVTIGGVQYAVIVDESDGFNNFNSAGGHYILMLCRPTSATDGLASNSLWGQNLLTHDMAAILTYWQQSNPLDDSGQPVKNGATGVNITSPLFDSSLFLTAVNAGFELDFSQTTSDSWVTNQFAVAMQGEPDP